MKGLALSRPLPYTDSLKASLKDRFNYASFSCAALVLSASKQSTYTSAILNGNSDQYMLAKCPPSAQLPFLQQPTFYLEEHVEDISDSESPLTPFFDASFKQQRDHFDLLASDFFNPLFVMIELCNDIKIDTIVISNNEYFSSTFRHFSLWVSTHYPPKQPTKTTTDEQFKSWIYEETNKYLQKEREDTGTTASKVMFKNGWKLIGFFEAANVRGPQVRNFI